MRRPARTLAAVGAAALAVMTLAACDKPVPQVTFLTGATTTVVHPSKYCFDPAAHCHSDDSLEIITARANSTIFVDVPKDVADEHWIVTAFKVSTAGKSTPLDGYGSAAVLHNRHSVRVAVPYGQGSYYLSVAEFRGPSQSGTWTVQVRVTE